MEISSTVQWWQEWQLRILVLGSVFLQLFLFLFASLRRRAIPPLLRSLIWLAYLGSDALAIYALANLFSRQKKQDYSLTHGKSILEVVWAPFLLMHLGGQYCITAYNIEDNELWRRHVLTALSQITVAIYVFWKSWPGGDLKLFRATILLFVPGILKCLEKPWALKKASIHSLVTSSGPAVRRAGNRKGEIIVSVEDYVRQARAQAQGEGVAEDHNPQTSRTLAERRKLKNEAYKMFLDHFPQAQGEGDAADHLSADHGEDDPVDLEAGSVETEPSCLAWIRKRRLKRRRQNQIRKTALKLERVKREGVRKVIGAVIPKLFVDLASAYPDRLCILKAFWVLGDEQAYVLLQKWLTATFNLLYTKLKILDSLLPTYVRASCQILPLAAIGLFHHSHKKNYDATDVKVTLILFICTILIEVYSLMGLFFVGLSGAVAQYSLIGFFARNRRHTKTMSILTCFKCKDFLDQHWCMKSCDSSFEITRLVRKYVKEGWKKEINDVDGYWKFNDGRGQCTLKNTGCEALGWSLKRPFDECVILWHIATDFCYYNSASADPQCAAAEDASGQGHESATEGSSHHKTAVLCRKISNYMTYLLFVNPEMLMAGTRRNLFNDANDQVEEILNKEDMLSINKNFEEEKGILKGIKRWFKKIREGENPSLKDIFKGTEREETQRRITRIVISRAEKLVGTESPPDEEECQATEENFIPDAWKLANALLALGDEKMWEVIEGVWVEMLCFSASRCRGYLHAKSLGTGVELLTYVWLLLSLMGMETLPERVQRTGRAP